MLQNSGAIDEYVPPFDERSKTSRSIQIYLYYKMLSVFSLDTVFSLRNCHMFSLK